MIGALQERGYSCSSRALSLEQLEAIDGLLGRVEGD